MISIVCLTPGQRYERRMERRRRALTRGLVCALSLVLLFNFGVWALALVLR